MILSGIGVGLTLPILMATATSSLPPHAFATGSAVINMIRQVGLAVGVAVSIAVVDDPSSPAAKLEAYDRAWVVCGVLAFAGAAATLLLGPPRTAPATKPAEANGLVSATH